MENAIDENTNDNILNSNIQADDPHRVTTEEIYKPITAEEILHTVKTLKNNKSSGLDNIFNEHLKSTINLMCPLFVKLFNVIFDKGIVPESWTLGNIRPIFKNKENPKDPENYRPITLLSNFGKLFTAIINNRLTKYAEGHNLLNGVQSAFRKKKNTLLQTIFYT